MMPVQQTGAFGELLRRWRETRRLSQLDLGLEAEVSPRHISFIETGRAQPSREMILTLSEVLDVPLRERNALLHAAGFAPLYRETSLDNPQMGQVRQALELLLRQHEPFSAIVFDRHWNLVMTNAAFAHFTGLLLNLTDPLFEPYTVLGTPRPNIMRLIFDPQGWRPYIVNWETVARSTLSRLHREALWDHDPFHQQLIQELLAYPGVPQRWREPDVVSPQDVLLPVEMKLGEHTLKLFSTLTTLGSPQDITLQELRIESFHPADEITEQIIRAMAA